MTRFISSEQLRERITGIPRTSFTHLPASKVLEAGYEKPSFHASPPVLYYHHTITREYSAQVLIAVTRPNTNEGGELHLALEWIYLEYLGNQAT